MALKQIQVFDTGKDVTIYALDTQGKLWRAIAKSAAAAQTPLQWYPIGGPPEPTPQPGQVKGTFLGGDE